MDSRAFSDACPGHLVRIESPRPDNAFVPEPLPTEWELPAKLWPLLMEAREAISRLDGIGQHIPHLNLLLRPLQSREALRSSSMEGTYATPEELLLYRAEPKEPRSSQQQLAEWQEVFNYERALAGGKEMLDEGYSLSLQFIRALHGLLLAGVRGAEKSPGEFRSKQVLVGAGGRFIPPPPEHLPGCLSALERSLREDTNIDPLVRAFMVHYQFETIHPFNDGNGRVGRLLLSLQIYHSMRLANPWLYLSAFFERHKDEYIDGLFGVSARNAWNQWIELCLRGAASQAQDAARRFGSLVELRTRFYEVAAESGASARLHALIDFLLESPVVTVPMVAKRSSVTYPTAKADLDRLAARGLVARSHKGTRPMYYFAPEIMTIAYGEPE